MPLSPRSWSHRTRRNLGIALALLAVFTVVGFFVLPPIVRSQLEQRLAAALGRPVSIGQVRLNPYTLGLTVERLDIRTRDGAASFLAWQRLYVNFDALASLGGDWVLGAVELDGFRVAAALEPDGSFDFADIVARLQAEAVKSPPAATPAVPPRPVRVGRLQVKEARVDFADRSRSRPFATTLGPLTFEVTEFRTVAEEGAPYRFAAVTEAGEKLTWTGTLATGPFRSSGELALEEVQLPKYAAYYADRLQADLATGRLTVRGGYDIDLTPQARVLRLTDGELQLRDVKLIERESGATALEVPDFAIRGTNFDAVAQRGSVASVRLSGGQLAVRRTADGTLNWQTMFAPPAADAPAAPVAAPATATATPAAAEPALDFNLGELALENFRLTVEDAAAPRPARLELAGVAFSLREVTLADGAMMPLRLAFDWLPQGRVTLGGTVAVRPELRAELQVEVADFALLPLSPYLEEFVAARFTQGTLSTTQHVLLSPGPDGPAVATTGSLRLDRLGLVDGVMQEELAGFTALALNGLALATAPQLTVSLEEIALTGPHARVVRRADGTLNVAGLARERAAEAKPSTVEPATTSEVAPATSAAPRITIGRVVLSEGDFSFADRSLAPEVRVGLRQFGGTIGGLSSENPARAEVDLRGSVDGVGPLTVTGRLDPLGAKRFIDLTVGLGNVDLLPFSPYSGKYAGYELARGKLGLDVRARVEGSQLQADNVITLDQFTFGAAVDSPEATKLPVRLGVALLKDIDGRIVIDVPMSGDLGDPDLRIGRVVVRVIVNLLTKAAVSPFALLGSMFGGGGDELAFQEFDPGSSALRETARAKLDTMIQALRNRPGLSLGLEGNTDGPADTHALKRVKLAALVRAQVWEERRALDPNQPPPDHLVIAPEAYAAKVKQLFDARFPPGTEFGTPLPAAPEVVAPPPPPRGFFKRVVRTVTFAERRERRATEKENAARAAAHAEAVAAAQATGLPLEEMTGRLAETMEVTPDDLRALAAARAAQVRDYLVTTGGIASERLFLAQPAAGTPENRGPRVFLTLQ